MTSIFRYRLPGRVGMDSTYARGMVSNKALATPPINIFTLLPKASRNPAFPNNAL